MILVFNITNTGFFSRSSRTTKIKQPDAPIKKFANDFFRYSRPGEIQHVDIWQDFPKKNSSIFSIEDQFWN